MSAGWPNKCTGKTAFVFGVQAASRRLGSRFKVSGSTSANRGRAPATRAGGPAPVLIAVAPWPREGARCYQLVQPPHNSAMMMIGSGRPKSQAKIAYLILPARC